MRSPVRATTRVPSPLGKVSMRRRWTNRAMGGYHAVSFQGLMPLGNAIQNHPVTLTIFRLEAPGIVFAIAVEWIVISL